MFELLLLLLVLLLLGVISTLANQLIDSCRQIAGSVLGGTKKNIFAWNYICTIYNGPLHFLLTAPSQCDGRAGELRTCRLLGTAAHDAFPSSIDGIVLLATGAPRTPAFVVEEGCW